MKNINNAQEIKKLQEKAKKIILNPAYVCADTKSNNEWKYVILLEIRDAFTNEPSESTISFYFQ